MLSSAERRARRSLSFTPPDNVMSPLARVPLVLNLSGRYFFDHMQKLGSWSFPGCLEGGATEHGVLLPMLRNLTGASYVDVRPLSGLNCMTVALSALCEPGDVIMSVPVESGGHPLLLVVPAVACFSLSGSFLPRAKRPEYLIFFSWTISLAAIGSAVALSGSPAHIELMLPWMAMPATTLASRFSLRGVIVGVALTIAVVIAVAFGLDSQGVLRSPLVIVTPLVLVLSVLILGTPIMYSDIEHRTGATLDALTGLLNRKALEELAERGRGEAMGLIVADVDHFKQINNRHGPARGDRVLPEVAALLQAHLRGGDLAFRLGGEEFLVLLPGSSQAVAADLAERIRSAIRECAIDRDLRIALSLGVAAAEGSECPRYEELFRRADGALYLAKQRGRNRACAEGSQTSVIAR